MVGIGWETVRLFLHVLAATIWVGGQLTLAALVPVLRAAGGDLPKAAAQAFNRVAWPAFWVLVATGIWNITESDDTSHAYRVTLVVKVVVVAISGATAFLHAKSRSTIGLAVFGALTGVSALASLFVGIMLAG